VEAVFGLVEQMLLGDWKTSSVTSRPSSMPVSSMVSRPMFLVTGTGG
jgi:hypothetical protein